MRRDLARESTIMVVLSRVSEMTSEVTVGFVQAWRAHGTMATPAPEHLGCKSSEEFSSIRSELPGWEWETGTQLLCELVAHKLAKLPVIDTAMEFQYDDHGPFFSHEFDESAFNSASFDSVPAQFVSRSDFDALKELYKLVRSELDVVEAKNDIMKRSLESLQITCSALESAVGKLAARSSPAAAKSANSSSGSSGCHDAMFACPVCNRRQKSPKSHAEHLHDAAKGLSCCYLDANVPQHAAMLQLWGGLAIFVPWYCGFLNCSHDISQITPADIAAYFKVQTLFRQSVMSGAIIMEG